MASVRWFWRVVAGLLGQGKADEDTAIRMAGEKARQIAEKPVKKKNVLEE